ncbi:MAG: class I SAM-dependent RNA methyltransferase [Acidimicrobiales bacterium]
MEVTVSGVAAGGDGLGRLPDGRVVFCEGGLPGERVAVELREERKDFARAVVVDVLEPSPGRRVAPCPYVAAGCGGCTWQHVHPGDQLTLMGDFVRDALRRIGGRPDVAVVAAPPERGTVDERGYRTTLRMAVDGAGRPAYRRRHTHDPIPVDHCLVAHPLLAELATEARFPGAREVGLRVGAATGERMAWPDRAHGRSRVPEGTRLGRSAAIHEVVAGRRWRVSGGAFFQSGPQAAEVLVASILAAAGPVAGTVVDLYAGGGLLGGSLVAANPGATLVAVESNVAAVADARANLADLGAQVVAAEVATYRGPSADLVVADPARTGLGPGGAAAAAGLGAATLVLVSCDPASFARDTRILATLGYDLEGVEVLDLFPDTFHAEVVSRFRAVGMATGAR